MRAFYWDLIPGCYRVVENTDLISGCYILEKKVTPKMVGYRVRESSPVILQNQNPAIPWGGHPAPSQ